jgi:hypothetical protein
MRARTLRRMPGSDAYDLDRLLHHAQLVPVFDHLKGYVVTDPLKVKHPKRDYCFVIG